MPMKKISTRITQHSEISNHNSHQFNAVKQSFLISQ